MRASAAAAAARGHPPRGSDREGEPHLRRSARAMSRNASNGPAMGAPLLARFGSRGYVDGHRQRLSLRDVEVTPNHHAIAEQWTFSDNFYADSDVSVDGHHWLVGAYPVSGPRPR